MHTWVLLSTEYTVSFESVTTYVVSILTTPYRVVERVQIAIRGSGAGTILRITPGGLSSVGLVSGIHTI